MLERADCVVPLSLDQGFTGRGSGGGSEEPGRVAGASPSECQHSAIEKAVSLHCYYGVFLSLCTFRTVPFSLRAVARTSESWITKDVKWTSQSVI